MEQRVAITGIGAVSPLGNTALATWAAMCAGTCGIGPITHFDTDAFAVKVAAEVKGFDGNEYFGKRDAKHLDPCVQFAMAASDEAMRDAGFDVEGAIDRERLGVYVGSGVGGMQKADQIRWGITGVAAVGLVAIAGLTVRGVLKSRKERRIS